MRPARTIEQWKRDKEIEAPPAKRREKAGIPVLYRGLTWDDMVDDVKVTTADPEGGTSAKRLLQEYAEDWPEMLNAGDGLVLLGPPGYGKSMGAALLAMDVIDQGGWVRFISFAELVSRETGLFALRRQAEMTEDGKSLEEEELKLDWIKFQCELLVLDDVGKERRSESDLAGDLFERIVRSRVDHGLSTIITSNLGMVQWSTYNASMESFLFQLGDIVEYTDGRDHRPDKRLNSVMRRRARRAGR